MPLESAYVSNESKAPAPHAELDDVETRSALDAWRTDSDTLPTRGRPAPLDEDEAVAATLRRRPAFPPSFLLLLAFGLALLAWDPTVELGYTLLGPSQAIDLGSPGQYRLDEAQDEARARIAGFASARRGSYSRYGETYEVVALTGLPVLVRRAPTPAPPASSVEVYQGEGRLVRLDDAPASFFERLVRPSARFASVRQTFAAYGELPPGRTAWLLLEGELPRAHWGAVALPLVLWFAIVALVWRALRGWLADLRGPRRP